MEPKGKKFYADGMTQKFEGLESEWPIFHAFMVIDGVFKNLDEQVEYHQSQLKKLIKYTDKGGKCRLQLHSSLSMTNINTATKKPPTVFPK